MNFSADVKKSIRRVVFTTWGFGLIMVGIFTLIRRFSLSVLWGAFIGCALASLNFFLLAVTLNQSVKPDGTSKSITAMSYTGRSIILLLGCILAITVLKVNPVATILPLVFPRITIAVMEFMLPCKKINGEGSDDNGS